MCYIIEHFSDAHTRNSFKANDRLQILKMIKYLLTKVNPPEVAAGCWYEISPDLVTQLFEDRRYTGEIVYLYDANEDGAESVIDSKDKLQEILQEAAEDNNPIVLHVNDVYAQSELFEFGGNGE